MSHYIDLNKYRKEQAIQFLEAHNYQEGLEEFVRLLHGYLGTDGLVEFAEYCGWDPSEDEEPIENEDDDS